MNETIARKEVIQKLADLRRAWEDETEVSLVEVNISLGLFLYDLAKTTFEFNQTEQRKILGGELLHEVEETISEENVWILQGEFVI